MREGRLFDAAHCSLFKTSKNATLCFLTLLAHSFSSSTVQTHHWWFLFLFYLFCIFCSSCCRLEATMKACNATIAAPGFPAACLFPGPRYAMEVRKLSVAHPLAVLFGFAELHIALRCWAAAHTHTHTSAHARPRASSGSISKHILFACVRVRHCYFSPSTLNDFSVAFCSLHVFAYVLACTHVIASRSSASPLSP